MFFLVCVSVYIILVSFFVISRAMASSSFTVHPRCSLAQREFVSEGRVWEGFEIDLSRFYYHGYSAMVDPFHDDVVRSSGVDGCDEFDNYFRGRGCEMSVDELACFCRRVLALEDPIPQTMDAFVSLVDETIISVVRAVVGVGPYSSGLRLMSIVVVFVRLLMLMGGDGVLPRESAFLCFGGSRVGARREIDGACGGGAAGRRAFAYKVIRRVASLGRCARSLVRVAWYDAVWLQDEVTRAVGLGDGGRGGSVPFCSLWRAAVGDGTQLGLLMGNVIGPAYVGVGRCVVAHEVDFTLDAFSADFRGADTMRGGVLDVMFSRSAAVVPYDGVDVCRARFFHTLHCVFLRWSGYAHWSADTAFVRDVLELFGFRVGVASGGGVQIELVGRRTWVVGGGCGMSYDSFCLRLDGREEFDSSGSEGRRGELGWSALLDGGAGDSPGSVDYEGCWRRRRGGPR